MSITRKMILGYIILIFIPVLGFGYHYYTQTYGNLTRQFVESRQKILEQAYANMKSDFIRIQSVQRLLQYNPYVTDYLDGVYQTDADSVYALIRYIRPLYTQSLFANPEIESIVIYKMKNRVLPVTDLFRDQSLLNAQIEEKVEHLKPGKGLWIREEPEAAKPDLIYYQHIYNTQFTERIGLLEIRIRNSLIGNFYAAAGVEGNWHAFLLSPDGRPLNEGEAASALDEQTLHRLGQDDSAFFINRKSIVNGINIDELNVRVVVAGRAGEVFYSIKQRELILVTLIVLLLVGLSVAYYAMASTITKRILRLARFMRTLNNDNLRQHIIKPDKLDEKDEIGFLTATYNSMVQRVDELINNAHRAELRNKEAAYMVLQAQIKPHFLYNTLETIRMVAESNNDREAADISFWFGKLMRYSLSSKQDVTTLERELEMITFYLKIHKMRLQARLTYEIDVSVEAKHIACPRFILQPIVENSIVHGASAVLRPVHVRLQVEETPEEIRIRIEDNGPGIALDKLLAIQNQITNGSELRSEGEESRGIGIYNVSERIKSFFRGTSRLNLESRQGEGTCVTIIIDKGEAKNESIDRG
ncbi:sensor histidine kinase [Paenibacillus prosopidis]|uniref:histidine kinase n=1 Tax=Paenibacillus prosopidis TaxID=630520 RepID=A0A368VK35_9BACL|nr:sensor histidine kinase [Paenibacillus prosopidis]RCW40893.1 two-component system sensor histidine kinase YesM [Paenibacillus prosopidis]